MNHNIKILVDCSGSMSGEPIDKVKNMLNDLFEALKINSETKSNTQICLSTYNMSVNTLLEKVTIDEVKVPDFGEITSGPKNLGLALKSINTSHDTTDLLLIITKGTPSDPQLFGEQSSVTQQRCRCIFVLHGNINKASAYSNITKNVTDWNLTDFTKLIQKVFGGQVTVTSDGRATLQEPPKSIEIII